MSPNQMRVVQTENGTLHTSHQQSEIPRLLAENPLEVGGGGIDARWWRIHRHEVDHAGQTDREKPLRHHHPPPSEHWLSQ